MFAHACRVGPMCRETEDPLEMDICVACLGC